MFVKKPRLLNPSFLHSCASLQDGDVCVVHCSSGHRETDGNMVFIVIRSRSNSVALWKSYQQTLRVVEYLFLSVFWHFLSFGFAFVCHFGFALSFFCHLVLHFIVIFCHLGLHCLQFFPIFLSFSRPARVARPGADLENPKMWFCQHGNHFFVIWFCILLSFWFGKCKRNA